MNTPPSPPTLRSEKQRDTLSDLLTLAQHHDLVVEKAWRAVADALVNVLDRKATADPLRASPTRSRAERAIGST